MRGDRQRVWRIGESWRGRGDRGGDKDEPDVGLWATTKGSPGGTPDTSPPSPPVVFDGGRTFCFCAQLPSSHGASSSMPTLPSPLLSRWWKAAMALGLILSSHSLLDICWASCIFLAAAASRLATGRPSLTR